MAKFTIYYRIPSTRLVQSQSTDMRIQYGQVVRCHKHICVRERNKSRAVQGWVCLKDLTGRLIGISLILSCYLQLGIGQVQLRQPSHERGLARCRGSDVAVVRPNGTTRLIPGKLDFAPGKCERIVLVARNGGSAIITRDIVVDTGLARWIVELLGSLVRFPTTSHAAVALALMRLGLAWLTTCKLGKFCQTSRVLFAGQDEMYWASSVQCQDCGIPAANHMGMGWRPRSWRKIDCCRASMASASTTRVATP